MKQCDIYAATHVTGPDGTTHRIVSKWGIKGRHLAKPSEGGFGCITEDGSHISMWQAMAYYDDESGRADDETEHEGC